MSNYCKNCYELQDQLDQLKAENEEWKKINKANAKSYEKHWYKLEKYKQALQDIKEIAEKAREDLYTCESIGYADDDLRAILQKISECEVEDVPNNS